MLSVTGEVSLDECGSLSSANFTPVLSIKEPVLLNPIFTVLVRVWRVLATYIEENTGYVPSDSVRVLLIIPRDPLFVRVPRFGKCLRVTEIVYVAIEVSSKELYSFIVPL